MAQYTLIEHAESTKIDLFLYCKYSNRAFK